MTSPDALVLIQNSWGEVDWILPLLWRLKHEDRARITVHFPIERVLEERTSYRDLDACLRSVARVLGPADVIQAAATFTGRSRLARRALLSNRPGRVRRAWRLLTNGEPCLQCLPAELLHAVTHGDPAWLLHDFSGQGHDLYHKTFPASRLVLFPHGTVEYGLGSDHLQGLIRRRFEEQPPPADATLLVGSKASADFFARATKVSDIRAVGHAMLDPQWLETLRRFKPEGPEREPAVVLVLIPKRKFPGPARYTAMVRQVRDAARKVGRPLVLKTHPRQERVEIEDTLADLDHEAVVADTSLGTALAPGDVAVTFPSSSCNQAVANHVPVIEFFDYATGDWPSFVREDGSRTSAYRMQGVALAASGPEDMERALAMLTADRDEYRRVAQAQWRALRSGASSQVDPGQAAFEALLDKRIPVDINGLQGADAPGTHKPAI